MKYKIDDILDNAKKEMQQSPVSPDMWTEIEKELQRNKPNIFDFFAELLMNRKMIVAAGVFAFIILISIVIINPYSGKMISAIDAEKMASAIDEDVYKAQKAYEKVIAQMEKNCPYSELTSEDDLVQMYFDKIGLLDQVIGLCKSSLKDNPYNPAIHKQLICAYNEKIEVYKELQILSERKMS